MKTLVIGDLHGQIDIVEKAVKTPYPLIFVGDYLDSFSRSIEDQVSTLKLVLSLVREGRAIALKGNHEMSYLKQHMRCSGYKPTTELHVKHLEMSLLRDFIKRQGFLISHAGVSQQLLTVRQQTIEEYLEAGDFNQIGLSRGGRSPSGGLYWCDWKYDFKPVPGVSQIVGHTRGNVIREKDNNFCIDVLENVSKPQGLLIENGEAEIFYL